MLKVFGKLLYAFAAELATFEAKVVQLMNESTPGLAVDLLPEWELDLGLPDECSNSIQTLVERQTAAHAKHVANYSGPSNQFWIDYAANLGMTITITEYFATTSVFRVDQDRVDRTPLGGVDGARLTSLRNRFRFTVNILVKSTVSVAYLECRFNQLKHSHTLITYNDLT